jgi:hypothetical protein
MITENKDLNRYCDICKYNFYKQDGTFNSYVKPASLVVQYQQRMGKVKERAYCTACVAVITEYVKEKWTLIAQIAAADDDLQQKFVNVRKVCAELAEKWSVR